MKSLRFKENHKAKATPKKFTKQTTAAFYIEHPEIS